MTRARQVTSHAASRRRVVRSAAAALTLSVLWAPAPLSAAPQVGERVVQVGGRAVRALCTTGPREVVLVHGEVGGADSWLPVLERLDGVVGACAYDRGLAASERAGWFELMDEMRRTHHALGFHAGYTLVGQGIGGLYARLYAAGRPADVGALVLVDPAHEDWADEARHAMPAAAWDEWARRRARANADGIVEAELAKHARAARLREMPVTVITATRRPDGAGWDARFFNHAARRVHASILEGIVHGRHIPASRSGHDVHRDEPELVAREIRRAARLTGGSER